MGLTAKKGHFLFELYKDACSVGYEFQIDPKILLAQAAVETGWLTSCRGKNLYGIKAGSSWRGDTVSFGTHEYENGERVSKVDDFRAYPSYRESMRDYCQLISMKPRYAKAWENRAVPAVYFSELQKAGYATDPKYAGMLTRVYTSVVSAIQEMRETGDMI